MTTQFHNETGENMASSTLTVRLDSELKDRLGRLADMTKRTKSFLAAEAIENYVMREMEIISNIEHSLDDMRNGRVSPHNDVVSEIDELITSASQREE